VADPQDPDTFIRSRLDWDEVEREPHRSLLEWHRSLIRLRRSRPDLLDGHLEAVKTVVDEEKGTLFMVRGAVAVAGWRCLTSTTPSVSPAVTEVQGSR